jgi:thiol-disulfide isomerase/thioredoxin
MGIAFEEYQTFIKQNGINVVKYYMNDCPPCRILKPAFERFIDAQHSGVNAIEVCLNEYSKEQLPQVKKAPTVEFFKNGISMAILDGKNLTLAKLNNILSDILN